MNRREAIAALTALPATARLSVAKVSPDEVIVLECDDHLMQETADRIRYHMQQIWPDRKVVVLDKGMRLKLAPQ